MSPNVALKVSLAITIIMALLSVKISGAKRQWASAKDLKAENKKFENQVCKMPSTTLSKIRQFTVHLTEDQQNAALLKYNEAFIGGSTHKCLGKFMTRCSIQGAKIIYKIRVIGNPDNRY